MSKVQLKYHILGKYFTYFGVYELFCPDYLFGRGKELDMLLDRTPQRDWIEKVQEYLSLIDPDRDKFIVRLWIGIVQLNPSKGPRAGRIIKKETFLRGLELGSFRICLYDKNQFNNFRQVNTLVDSKRSTGLDTFLRDVLIPDYLRRIESSRSYLSMIELRTYISLYMSKKFGLI